jgi:hypothetical protein
VMAGAVTGITVSPITTASELVKIRLQVQRGPGWFDPKEHFPGTLIHPRLGKQPLYRSSRSLVACVSCACACVCVVRVVSCVCVCVRA